MARQLENEKSGMERLILNILGNCKTRWTGIGQFFSVDHIERLFSKKNWQNSELQILFADFA